MAGCSRNTGGEAKRDVFHHSAVAKHKMNGALVKVDRQEEGKNSLFGSIVSASKNMFRKPEFNSLGLFGSDMSSPSNLKTELNILDHRLYLEVDMMYTFNYPSWIDPSGILEVFRNFPYDFKADHGGKIITSLLLGQVLYISMISKSCKRELCSIDLDKDGKRGVINIKGPMYFDILNKNSIEFGPFFVNQQFRWNSVYGPVSVSIMLAYKKTQTRGYRFTDFSGHHNFNRVYEYLNIGSTEIDDHLLYRLL
nr:MAG: hypothetical protein [Rhabdoviridae sp.]